MAPTWSYILPREGEVVTSDPTSSSVKLDTGAIAGIACAAGALFLGGIGLFVVYWRRQKSYDKDEEVFQRPVEENPFACSSPPAYTLDYKMNRTSSTGGSVSSYTHTSEPVRPESFSPLGGMVSAMPTHPAYIPKAFVRGSTPAPLPPTPEDEALRLPPTPPSPPTPPRRVHQSKSQPDDLIIQAYLRTTDGERVPSEIIRFAASEDPSRPASRASSNLPLRNAQPPARTTPPPRGIPIGLTIPTFTSRAAQPSPPRLHIDTFHTRNQNRPEPVEITAPAIYVPPSSVQPPHSIQPFRQKYHAHRPPPPLTQRPPYDDTPALSVIPTRPSRQPVQAPPILTAHTPTIGRAVTTTTITSGGNGHKRDNSANKRIGDWIAAQPNFRDASMKGVVNPNVQYAGNRRGEAVEEGDVW
ncbi:hypothetical protein QBC34DRAFT_115508 [Podospora aff. communis PSN243]|uniref:Uncharacterized protein n=1 Tax=Podospora aff. communis PSN243 TaxID=3040156 RepID=A0AAV9GHI3_9PEZI|nr:hypothetical protein QBC34DRAFT_115508 [Podospora aff. communis PSN243]